MFKNRVIIEDGYVETDENDDFVDGLLQSDRRSVDYIPPLSDADIEEPNLEPSGPVFLDSSTSNPPVSTDGSSINGVPNSLNDLLLTSLSPLLTVLPHLLTLC